MQRHDDVADRTFAGGEVNKDVAAAGLGDGVENVRGGGGARHGDDYIPIREYVKLWRNFSEIPPMLMRTYTTGRADYREASR